MKMKIYFVNDTFLVGRGSDTVIYEIAKRLGKKHDVRVVAALSDYKEKNFKIEKIKAKKLFSGTIKDFLFLLNVLKFRNYIKRQKYDLVNLHHSTLFLGLIGLPNIIVTYHGSPPDFSNPIIKLSRNFINILGKISLRFSKKVITISEYLKKELIKFGVPREKIVIIPNGVSEEFKISKEDKNFMLYVGRLEKHKKVDELIKLAKIINFPLKIVGDGPERNSLIILSDKLKSPVEFLGKVERKKLIEIYRSCSFFVSASRWEGFGLTFLEANACGKCVVGYEHTAIKERIIDGYNGFIAKNFRELIKICRKLKNNKKLRKKLGYQGYNYAKKFKWNRIVKEYERIFKISIS